MSYHGLLDGERRVLSQGDLLDGSGQQNRASSMSKSQGTPSVLPVKNVFDHHDIRPKALQKFSHTLKDLPNPDREGFAAAGANHTTLQQHQSIAPPCG
jgi:hypothetical protein